MTGPAVYLAGPEVFLPEGAAIGEAKKRICRDHGLVGCFPLDIDDDLGDLGHLSGPEQAGRIFDGLVALLERCDAVIANLTPFRGPSADVGTVWELGWAHGRGLPVFAYTNHPAHYGERVTADGLRVEAFDLADNLMLEGSVRASGFPVERHHTVLDPVGALELLSSFETCVRHAAATLAT